MKEATHIIRHGHIVTMDSERTVIPGGSIAIVQDGIAAVGSDDRIMRDYSAPSIIDASNMLVLPGLVDAHFHPGLQMLKPLGSLMRGDMMGWPATTMNGPFCLGGDLEALVAGHIEVGIGPERMAAFARLAFAVLLKAGVTSFNDGGGEASEGVCRAVIETGIRGAVTPDLRDLKLDDGKFVRGDTDNILASAEAFHNRWHGKGDGRLQSWFSPIMAFASSDQLLCGCKALADKHGVGMATHVATLKHEADATQKHHGRNPIERLHELGVCGPNLTCVHAGWANDTEIGLLAATGTAVAHCPHASTLTPAGYFSQGAIPRMLAAGVTIGLGSDVAHDGTLIDQLRSTASYHKDRTLDATTLDAPAALELATLGSAKACLMEGQIGSLQPGYLADITIVDMGDIHWQPSRQPVRHFVENGRPSEVDTVIVGGEVLVRGRRLTQLDEKQIASDANKAFTSLAADLARAR